MQATMSYVVDARLAPTVATLAMPAVTERGPLVSGSRIALRRKRFEGAVALNRPYFSKWEGPSRVYLQCGLVKLLPMCINEFGLMTCMNIGSRGGR